MRVRCSICGFPQAPASALAPGLQVVLYYHDARTHELVARVSSKRLEVVSRAGQVGPSFAWQGRRAALLQACTHQGAAPPFEAALLADQPCMQFLRSVDAPLAAVVAAKRLALDARSSGAQGGDPKKLESVRLGVSAQVALIASRFGKDVQVGMGQRGAP